MTATQCYMMMMEILGCRHRGSIVASADRQPESVHIVSVWIANVIANNVNLTIAIDRVGVDT